MAPAPLAGSAVTGTGNQAAGTGYPRPGACDPRPPPPPATACSDRTSSARAETRGDRLRRVAGLLRRAATADGSCRDPLFERPDLIEDDYYRFLHQPHGDNPR